ncbi:prepilin-type N-terminal cleavage/methylation domain-containing protein [Elusimicrobiota bacterium]
MLDVGLRKKKSDGFTLLEVLVSIMLVSIAVSAMMSIFAIAGKQKSVSTNEISATSSASEALEQLRNLVTADVGDPALYPTHAGASAYVDDVDSAINPAWHCCANKAHSPLAGSAGGMEHDYCLENTGISTTDIFYAEHITGYETRTGKKAVTYTVTNNPAGYSADGKKVEITIEWDEGPVAAEEEEEEE